MRIKVKRDHRDEAHRWFAWHPVFVEESRTWVWLEHVIRRRTGGDAYGDFWYYRLTAGKGAE
jgi:hypothetical protein